MPTSSFADHAARVSSPEPLEATRRATPPPGRRPGVAGLRIAVVIGYLEGRQEGAASNRFPRNQLWGADALAASGAQVEYIAPRGRRWERWAGWLSTRSRWRIGNLEFDLQVLARAGEFDLIYVPNGTLLLTQLARALRLVRAPYVAWTYTPPDPAGGATLHRLWARRPFRAGIDGLACLTAHAASACRTMLPDATVRYVPWGADSQMFPGSETAGEFFFACGRTNRDYRTLIEAARRSRERLVILISPSLLEGIEVPPNVTLLEGPRHADSDQGIGYDELIHRYYANARAVLICRKDIPSDTSGLTNMLEALAMGRPVAITRTGALDLDVEAEGVGRFVAPGDVDGWVRVMRDWSQESAALADCRRRARALIERHWNHHRHGADVVRLISDVLDRAAPAGRPHVGSSNPRT